MRYSPKGLRRVGGAVATLAAVAAVASGCGGSGSDAASTSKTAAAPTGAGTKHADLSDLSVGYSTEGLFDTLQRTWAQTTCKTVVAAGGKCTIADAQLRADKQVSDVEDLIAKGANFIVVNPADAKAIVPAILEANQKGIPVMTIDSAAAGGKVISAVRVDNVEAGKGAADYCAKKYAGQNVEVAEFQGAAGQANTTDRHAGWAEGLKEHPNLKDVYTKYTNWDTATAQSQTQDLLTAHPNVKCIWTHADAIVLGVARALKAAGKTDVTTIGMGMYGGGPQAIEAGDVTASWYMNPEPTGVAAGRAIEQYWKTGEVKSQILIPLTFVTKANVKKFPWK